MQILGVNGSPVQRGSYALLQQALKGARRAGADSAFLDLNDYTIEHCQGCDSCLKSESCVQEDELEDVADRLPRADGLIFAAPSHFGSVPAAMKNFMDRTRYLKMKGHVLQDKPFAAISSSGLKHGGAEHVISSLHYYALLQGMVVVGGVGDPRFEPSSVIGTRKADDGFRRVSQDTEALKLAGKLGERMVEISEKMQ